MIKINLLPAEAGKRTAAKAKAAGPSLFPFFALLALVYGGAGVGGYMAYKEGADMRKKAALRTKQRDEKKEEVKRREKEFEQNNLLSQEIEEKYAVVQALGPESRIFWSEKVNMIAQARLNLAVYVTKLQLTEKIDEIETAESQKRRAAWKAAQKGGPVKTPEPKPIKEPVINQVLTIQAIAYGTDSSQRLRQVTAFYENLRSLEWARESGAKARFRDKVYEEFDTLPQKLARVGGVDVLRFGFTVKADSQKASASAAAAKAGTSTAGTRAAVAKPAGGTRK